MLKDIYEELLHLASIFFYEVIYYLRSSNKYVHFKKWITYYIFHNRIT